MAAISLKFVIEKLQQQPMRISKRIREHGVGNLFAWSLYQMQFRLRERRLGINTMEHAYGINIWGKNGGQYYDPIDYRCLDIILDYFRPAPEHDTFLDYGCGLGRAIIAAAGRPFRRVLGVENNEECLDLCHKHVAAAKRKARLACPIEIIAADAERFEVPDDVTKILMYNPFVEQSVMNQVLERVRESLERRPRQLDLVYAPLHKHAHFLDACPFLEFAEHLPTGFWDHVTIKAYRAHIQ